MDGYDGLQDEEEEEAEAGLASSTARLGHKRCTVAREGQTVQQAPRA